MFKAPRQLPPLEVLLRDLGNPAAALTARALGVSERTVYGWQAAGQLPRPAHLALFWESRWGQSVAECEAINGERWARGQVHALEREAATLRARVAYLERVGSFGSANGPLFLGEAAQAVALDLHHHAPALFAR